MLRQEKAGLQFRQLCNHENVPGSSQMKRAGLSFFEGDFFV
jgi:hypothetical protein